MEIIALETQVPVEATHLGGGNTEAGGGRAGICSRGGQEAWGRFPEFRGQDRWGQGQVLDKQIKGETACKSRSGLASGTGAP